VLSLIAPASAVACRSTPGDPRLQGIALASVFQIVIDEAGRRTRDGQSQAEIADGLYPMVERILVELDRWLTLPQPAG
jgi:hypothetical protein